MSPDTESEGIFSIELFICFGKRRQTKNVLRIPVRERNRISENVIMFCGEISAYSCE